MRIASLLFVFALAACASRGEPRFVRGSVEHQDRTRAYLVFAPKTEKPRPLLVALHGGGGTMKQVDRGSNQELSRQAKARGWVLVIPEGINKGWNDGRVIKTRRDAARADVDDVGFIAKLIDKMVAEHQVDPARVYTAGISNGGFMSMRLALELSDRVAAVGILTAQLATVHDGKRPSAPVGMLIINGTEDPLIPYEGGTVTLFGTERGVIHSTDETLRRWRDFNGCTGPGDELALDDKDPKDGTRVHRTDAVGCKAGVSLVRVEGGGHTWPGGTQYLPEKVIGRVSRDVDASELIFEFLKEQRR